MGQRASKPPSIPADVQAVFDACPPEPRAYLYDLRTLIFATAARTPAIGRLNEALRWGEPSYLTEESGSGTTVRIGWKPKTPHHVSLFVSCQTPLIEQWRANYEPVLTFIGNREIALPLAAPLPSSELIYCISTALTYHLRKFAQ